MSIFGSDWSGRADEALPTDTGLPGEVGVVVIGRNEGERLKRCLTAVGIAGRPTVYVDSGSTDGSVELAQSLGVDVIVLDSDQPYTAARGRNAGLEHLIATYPALKFAQMLDGDTEIDDAFISLAYEEIIKEHTIGAVSGRLRERHRDASKYNRLCDMEWNHAPGSSEVFSGNVLLRIESWRDAGGYDETLIAGEDPELSQRVRNKGWTISCIDAEMGLHDADMHQFSQWWTRATRAGHAFAEGADLERASGRYAREIRSIWFWGGALPAAIVATAAAGFVKRPAWLGLIAAGLYPVQWWRIRGHRLAMGDDASDSELYATHVLIGKFAELRGALRYYRNRRSGKRQELVEYRASIESTEHQQDLKAS